MKKIYTENAKEVKIADDWRCRLANPKTNWKKGKSAYELAYSWLDSEEDMPNSLQNLLNSSETFKNLTIDKAIVEKKVQFDNFGRPSHTDLMIYGNNAKGKIVIAVEGKESEPFDKDVSEWIKIKEDGSDKEERLRNLLVKLGLSRLDKEKIGKIKYQLLHRTISALIEGKIYGAHNVMMLVHSFLDIDEKDHFNDYLYFCSLFGIVRESITRNKILSSVTVGNINLSFGWLRDKKK